MSISDHFDRTSEEGFSRSIDPRSAQRQFNMSLGLVVILTVAAAGVALTSGIVPLQHSNTAAAKAAYIQMPQMIHVRSAGLGQGNG